MYSIFIIIKGKTALFEQQPSSEDFARFVTIGVSLLWILQQQNFTGQGRQPCPNPNLQNQISIHVPPVTGWPSYTLQGYGGGIVTRLHVEFIQYCCC
jgi:hypothetical protein